jgi:hypothetical protein
MIKMMMIMVRVIVEHVWTCRHSEVQQMWAEAVDVLTHYLRTQSTQPEISKAIIDGLNGWRKNSNVEYVTHDHKVLLAAETQHQSGWKHFFEGRPNVHWVKLQSRYFSIDLKSQQSGKRWMTELIKKMWGVAWDLWEHQNGILHKKETQALNFLLSQEPQQLWEHQTRTRLVTKKGHPTSLAQLLQWPTAKQEHWRNITRIRIQRKEQEKVSPSFAAEREGMRRFLFGRIRSAERTE